MGLRIVHIGESLLPQFGGTAAALRNTANMLAARGMEVTVLLPDRGDALSELRLDGGVRRVTCAPWGPRRLGFSYDLKRRIAEVGKPDLIHLGLWRLYCRQGWQYAVQNSIPTILSIHGMLEPAALYCAVILAFVGATSNGQVLARMGELKFDMRAAVVRDSLKMWIDRPFLGWGLGTFPEVYPHYRSFYTNLLVNAVHNDYVQVLVETGIAGLALTIWFIIELYGAGRLRSSDWQQDWRQTMRLAALLGCTGILAHSFVDFNMQVAANAAMFFFLAGLAGHVRGSETGGGLVGRWQS
jgi:hypothetical protein